MASCTALARRIFSCLFEWLLFDEAVDLLLEVGELLEDVDIGGDGSDLLPYVL